MLPREVRFRPLHDLPAIAQDRAYIFGPDGARRAMRRLLSNVQRAIAEGGARLKNGYIRLYRGLLEHPLVLQLPAAWFRIFIVILLKVNWKPGTWWNGNQNIEIQPGQLVTSVDKLSKAARASSKETRGALGYLERAQIAAIQRANRYSIITILNWDTYQNSDEPEGKVEGKVEGNQRARSGQTEGKLDGNNQRSKEGNQGRRETNVKSKTDSWLTSPKTGEDEPACRSERFALDRKADDAMPDNPAVVALVQEDCRKVLSEAIARHFGSKTSPGPLWPLGLVEPELSIVDQVLKAIGADELHGFCKYLGTMPAKHQQGGHKAPRTFAWYVRVAQNYARGEQEQKPTNDLCRHSRPYGVCCNTPEQDERMSDAFSTLAPVRQQDDPREGAA